MSSQKIEAAACAVCGGLLGVFATPPPVWKGSASSRLLECGVCGKRRIEAYQNSETYFDLIMRAGRHIRPA